MVSTPDSVTATYFFITDTRATDRTAIGWAQASAARSASRAVAALAYVQPAAPSP